MLAATLRRAGACRRVTAFVSQTRSRSAFSRITALRRRAPLSSPMMTTTIAAASSASSSSSQAAAAAAATSTSTPPEPKQQRRRFPPLAPGSVAPEEYEARLEEKVERVRSLLAGVLPSSRSEEPLRGGEEDGGRQQREPAPFPLEVFASADQGFRLRAEFRVWHDGGDLYYVMFDTRDPSVKPPPKVRIDHFPVGPPMMNALMEETLAAMREDKGEGDDDGEEEAAEAAQEEEGQEEEVVETTARRRQLRRRKHPKSRGGPLRRKLFQANFHTTLSGECIVTLIYHRNLGGEAEGAAWEAAAELLRQRLLRAASEFGCRSVDVIGRSRGVARVVEKDHVQEELEVEFGGRKHGGGREEGGGAAEPSPPSSPSSSSSSSSPPPRRSLRYRQTEGSFSQPNGRVCESMLGWAWRAALGSEDTPRRRSDDLLELYCGNGNFTAALAPAFRRVVATEVSRSGVASAIVNLAENAGEGDDVVVARADAERVAAALAALDKGEREGEGGGGGGDTIAAAVAETAEKDDENNAGENEAADDVFAGVVPTSLGGNADLSTFDLRTLFVDPPRAGVGLVTGRVLARFDRVLYVSCNPESLAADVAALVSAKGEGSDSAFGGQRGGGTHEVTAAAVFDQFPYTDHIECGLLLERKKKEELN